MSKFISILCIVLLSSCAPKIRSNPEWEMSGSGTSSRDTLGTPTNIELRVVTDSI